MLFEDDLEREKNEIIFKLSINNIINIPCVFVLFLGH